MLTIDSNLYISSGIHRDVFVHPKQPDKCVKIERPDVAKTNAVEARYYRKHNGCAALPRYYGFCNTNLGQGLIVELIKDFNGQISKTLRRHLSEHDLGLSEYYDLLSWLEQQFIAESILVHEIGLNNLLIRQNLDGSMTPILVDGFGPRRINRKTIFKLIFPFLARRKTRKEIRNTKLQIEQFINENR